MVIFAFVVVPECVRLLHLREQIYVYLVAVFVDKPEIEKSEFVQGCNFEFTTIFPAPASFQRPHSFLQISGHIGMHHQRNVTEFEIAHNAVQLVFYRIDQQNCRTRFACAMASRAGLVGANGCGRTHTLPRDLHQAKVAEWQNVVSGAVAGHQFCHAFV